ADSATLALLHTLLANTDLKGLLVIGEYRDNEVGDRHPLMLTLGEIRAAGTPVREITLGPLPPAHLTQFVADTLHTDGDRARPLADLVLSKTAGNPFFVTQLLRTLHQERLVTFDYAARHWQFDLDRIRRIDITDNVVDLMAAKLRKLPAPTQEALELDERIFDIVQHLNLGSDLIADDAERVALARLNLSAGQKAKASTAHAAALGYLQAGMRVVTDVLWDSDYGLAFALHLEGAECL